MASRRECESWIGDTKNDYCRKGGHGMTQRWVRQAEHIGGKTAYRYGWSCDYCQKFQLSYEFIE